MASWRRAIASTRGRNAEETQRFNARAGDLTKDKPLIVLVVAEQELAYAQGARGKEAPLGRLGGPRGPSVCERKERSAPRGVPAREWPAQDSRHGRSMPVLWQVSSGA